MNNNDILNTVQLLIVELSKIKTDYEPLYDHIDELKELVGGGWDWDGGWDSDFKDFEDGVVYTCEQLLCAANVENDNTTKDNCIITNEVWHSFRKLLVYYDQLEGFTNKDFPEYVDLVAKLDSFYPQDHGGK